MKKNGALAAVAGVLALGALTLGLLAGCGGSGSKKDPGLGGDPVKGKEVFEGTCSSCHGMDATGLPGLGKPLTKSTFADGLSDKDLLAFIQKGRPTSDPLNTTGVEMPSRGGNPALTDQDLINAIAYLRTVSEARNAKK